MVNWNYPTTMWIGEKRIEDLSLACKELGISNPLFVTDKDLINLDIIKNIILSLKKSFQISKFTPKYITRIFPFIKADKTLLKAISFDEENIIFDNIHRRIDKIDLNDEERTMFDKGVANVKDALSGIEI